MTEEKATRHRRKYARWYLYDRSRADQDLTTGIPVTLYEPGWFKDKLLGDAIIRDIGPGGAGLHIANSIELPSEPKTAIMAIEVKNGKKQLLEFRVRITRVVNDGYHFCGVEWVDSGKLDMTSIVQHWDSYFPAERLENFEPPGLIETDE